MEKPIILFDGICNLCNGLVNFIIKVDKGRKFLFSPLQSEFSKKHLNHNTNTEISYDSIIMIDNKKTYVKSDAVLRIAKYLGGVWKYISYLSFIPASIRDFFYDLVAENRYGIFGKQQTCMIPDENIKDRFLT